MTKTELAGHNIKEIALIILICSVAFTFAVVAVGIVMAIKANPNGISFSGSIDLGQFVGVVIGISVTAVVFVGQQLTARQTQAAAAQTDAAWLEDSGTGKPPGS